MADPERAIETLRLTLEPQRAAHADAMFEVLSDPAIYAHENAPPKSLQSLRERYTKLETRRSGDGREQWLNWVLRQRSRGDLIGYVQATVQADGHAFIAYELGSAHWGRGLGSEAVAAMIDELPAHYGVHTVLAVFKRSNRRSRRLLERLGFAAARAEDSMRWPVEADEDLMLRHIAATVAAPS
jgi:ribosomal-protein-alanine N-acetyltransferase